MNPRKALLWEKLAANLAILADLSHEKIATPVAEAACEAVTGCNTIDAVRTILQMVRTPSIADDLSKFRESAGLGPLPE